MSKTLVACKHVTDGDVNAFFNTGILDDARRFAIRALVKYLLASGSVRVEQRHDDRLACIRVSASITLPGAGNETVVVSDNRVYGPPTAYAGAQNTEGVE